MRKTWTFLSKTWTYAITSSYILVGPWSKILNHLNLGFLISETENWRLLLPRPHPLYHPEHPSPICSEHGLTKAPFGLDYFPPSVVHTGTSLCPQQSLPVPVGYTGWLIASRGSTLWCSLCSELSRDLFLASLLFPVLSCFSHSLSLRVLSQ